MTRATLYALSSGAGRAGVAVIRLSGPQAGAALAALAGPLPEPRRATVRTIRDAAGQGIDQGLILWFPAPASFTGEDVAELHVHGGRAVVAAVLRSLGELPGLEPAGPGAFTRRAFDHGKLDLTQVEGLADLIDADTEAQRRQALRQLDGALGRLAEDWRRRLLRALALVEAGIDFVDEGLPDDLADQVRPDLTALAAEMRGHLAQSGGERLRDGFTVAILGAPNAGKSSLLNRLAGREAAIVSARAGTTRDMIEVHLDLGGLPVTLVDTAGLRAAADEIEGEGIRRALARADQADLKLLLVEAGTAPDPALVALDDGRALWVASKADLGGAGPGRAGPGVALSARTGQGIEMLLELLRDRAEQAVGGAGLVTRDRHRQGLTDCVAAIERFLADPGAAELAAEDLRHAATALGRLVGRIDVEDLLDVIFREFCIGK